MDQLRSEVDSLNNRWETRTQDLVAGLKDGPASLGLVEASELVDRFTKTPGVASAIPEMPQETAEAFVAVLEAHPIASLRSRSGVGLELNPEELKWSAGLLVAGATALAQTGHLDGNLFDVLVSVAFGGANRADLLTRYVLTGGSGVDTVRKLTLGDDLFDTLDEVLARHNIRDLTGGDCMRELRAAAVGFAAAQQISRQPQLAGVTKCEPDHGRPGTIVVLSGPGWPAVQPDGAEVVFTSNGGAPILGLDQVWFTPRGGGPTGIAVTAPSGVGVGPVGLRLRQEGGGSTAGAALSRAIEHCMGAGRLSEALAGWVPQLNRPPAGHQDATFFGGPRLTSVEPAVCHEGDTVTISGHEFAVGDLVRFDSTMETLFISDTSLTTVVTGVGGSRNLSVETANGDSSNAVKLQILPTLVNLSTSQGKSSASVEAWGTGFDQHGAEVSMDGVSMVTVVISSRRARFQVSLTNVPAEGKAVQIRVRNADGESTGPMPFLVLPSLTGWVDLHTHPMINLAFGGKLVHGGPDVGSLLPTDTSCRIRVRAESIEHALSVDTPSHGSPHEIGCGDLVRQLALNKFQESNHAVVTTSPADGYPWFVQWPKWNDITHQKMWFEWIERGVQGGQRVMVALATNNQILGNLVSTHRGFPQIDDLETDDKTSGDLQLTEIKAFVLRHSNFMELALTAADIFRIVSADKLAVVMGVELDDIGNFNSSALGSMSLDAAQIAISAEIQRLYDSGVRYIFPIHVLDNNFGGTAIYMDEFNAANRLQWGEYWDIECSYPSDQITHLYNANWDPIAAAVGWGKLGIDPFRISGPGPDCSLPVHAGPARGNGHRNKRRLTSLGKLAIKEMMKRGMIIDIDHMSHLTAEDTLGLAQFLKYPVVSGHTGIRGRPGGEAENSRTPSQLARIAKLHGMFGLGCAGAGAQEWADLYQVAARHMGYNDPDPLKADYQPGAISLGTDLNGLVTGPRPGGQGSVDYSGGALSKSTTGNKTWDYNYEGVAHYGMLPDFLQHVGKLSTPGFDDSTGRTFVVGHLQSGAEYFWRMWQMIEAASLTVV